MIFHQAEPDLPNWINLRFIMLLQASMHGDEILSVLLATARYYNLGEHPPIWRWAANIFVVVWAVGALFALISGLTGLRSRYRRSKLRRADHSKDDGRSAWEAHAMRRILFGVALIAFWVLVIWPKGYERYALLSPDDLILVRNTSLFHQDRSQKIPLKEITKVTQGLTKSPWGTTSRRHSEPYLRIYYDNKSVMITPAGKWYHFKDEIHRLGKDLKEAIKRQAKFRSHRESSKPR